MLLFIKTMVRVKYRDYYWVLAVQCIRYNDIDTDANTIMLSPPAWCWYGVIPFSSKKSKNNFETDL